MSEPHHVVIIGAGFGGLAAARRLAKTPVRVTVIDKRNYHLFQPLLYQVATAALSPAEIAAPIRGVLAKQKNAEIVLGKVLGVDIERRRVKLSNRELSYDSLIVATGARHSYFGRDDWEPFAPGLKKIEDATALRHRVLLAFERAEATEDEETRRALLTFVVIGAGPTGVELSGAIAELAHSALAKDFRRIDPRSARILLVEAGPRVLASFPLSLSDAAAKDLAKLGVEVRLGAPVTNCDADGVVVGEERIAARTIAWAAGVEASSAAKWLGAAHDRVGRVVVTPYLTLPDNPEIFIIGDTAAIIDSKGAPVPGIAPAAKQGGSYAADVITARLKGRSPVGPFVYRHMGSMATVGRGSAVADLGWVKLQGGIAWWVWGVVHLLFLMNFRSKVAVAIDWFWSYLTFQRGARLITGSIEE